MNQHELFSSPASSEGWISLPGELLATRPGRYILSVTAFSGDPAPRMRCGHVCWCAWPHQSSLHKRSSPCDAMHTHSSRAHCAHLHAHRRPQASRAWCCT
jgi:hypothetical protein